MGWVKEEGEGWEGLGSSGVISQVSVKYQSSTSRVPVGNKSQRKRRTGLNVIRLDGARFLLE